jgi:uncharacterized membrane protein
MPSDKRGASDGIFVERTVTVDRPAEELYRFWRNLENLPSIMDHLKSVKAIDARHSEWVARGPLHTNFKWKSELTEDVPNERLGWQSLEGSEVSNEGTVEFRERPEGRGTEVKVRLRYNPPGGKLGAMFATIFKSEPSQEVREGLRRFKQVMETGEFATTEGQSSGRQ